MEKNDIYIGQPDDALAILDELITDLVPSLVWEGAWDYFIPRLEALRDAIMRGII